MRLLRRADNRSASGADLFTGFARDVCIRAAVRRTTRWRASARERSRRTVAAQTEAASGARTMPVTMLRKRSSLFWATPYWPHRCVRRFPMRPTIRHDQATRPAMTQSASTQFNPALAAAVLRRRSQRRRQSEGLFQSEQQLGRFDQAPGDGQTRRSEARRHARRRPLQSLREYL